MIGDGVDYVIKCEDDKFDVVIVDSTDPHPNGIGSVLFTENFYEHVKRILTSKGVVSTLSLMPMRYDPKTYRNSLKNLRSSFSKDKTWIYLLPMDSFQG